MTDVWDAIATTGGDGIHRDRYEHAVLIPARGGKEQWYYRPSKLGDELDNRWNLEQWFKRKTAIGLMLRPDLLSLVAAKENDDKALNKVCDDAIEVAKGRAGANEGVALHTLLERKLRGEDLSHIPAVLRADVDACLMCLERHQLEVVEIEQFVVTESVRAAGTRDLLLRWRDRLVVGDWKSGPGAVKWGLGNIAVQLAVYAHAETAYDPATKTHTPLEPCDLVRAYALHVPAGSGQCDLVEVDIHAGWEAAKTAIWIKEWQKRKDLGRSVTAAADEQSALREQIGFRIEALPPEAILALSTMVVNAGLPRVSKATGQDLADLVELVTFIEGEYEVPFEKPKRTRTK